MSRFPDCSPDELVEYINLCGESANIDAKVPMEWDGGEKSAELAKDIVAFANSRDGGVLVIGKEEVQSGKFETTGVSAQQAATFDTTKVATWINNRFSPPVNLVLNQA
ncbi:MAG TPA: ATP-binding protein [Thermoguttaceae bacterium]|nr:ATP-binding protein [Thermoguttaceae bacterium]